MALIMKIMIAFLWLLVTFRLWCIYECFLGYYYNSPDFSSNVFSLLIIIAQKTFASSKLEMGELDRDVGYVQILWWRHHSDVKGTILVSLLLSLVMFGATVYYLDSLWVCKLFFHFFFLLVLVLVNFEP